jgi:Serine phosphatase RsbU, regulator of sigma subunit
MLVLLKKGVTIVGVFLCCSLAMSQSLAQTRGFNGVIKDSLIVEHSLRTIDSLQQNGFQQESLMLADSVLIIAKELNNQKQVAAILFHMAVAYSNIGDFNTALKQGFESLQIRERMGDSLGISKSLNSIGRIYYNKANYSKAYDHLLRSYKIAYSLKDTLSMLASIYNLGLVLNQRGEGKQALDFYHTASVYAHAINNQLYLAYISNSLGNYFSGKGMYENALSHYSYSLKYFLSVGDEQGASMLYNNLGLLFGNLKEFGKALVNLQMALQIKQRLKDRSSVASIYQSMAQLYYEKGDYARAIVWGKKSVRLSDSLGALRQEEFASTILAKAFEKIGDLKQAIAFYKKSNTLHDSIFSQESNQQMAESEMIWKMEMQQYAAKTRQEKENAVSKEHSQNLIFVRNLLVLFIFVLLFSITIIIFFYRKKMKATRLLQYQYKEIEKQSEEIATQRDEIENQRNSLANLAWELQQKHEETTSHRDELQIQRDVLTQQKKEITDSIQYAKRIQSAALPSMEAVTQLFPNSFVFNQPKSIVGGDFYWVARVGKYRVLAVADCTGHGVPGGFMSMLGIALLNEIIKREEIKTASEILDELRDYLISSLQPSRDMTDPSDGMDMVLAVFDDDMRTMQYAAANQAFYLVRKDETGIPRLKDFWPDRMPIGNYQIMKPFTNNVVQLMEGDVLYFFSDGFPDQFGGTEGKKLCPTRFKQMLFSFYDRPIASQGELLRNSLERWKGNQIQVDDVLVFGIKI